MEQMLLKLRCPDKLYIADFPLMTCSPPQSTGRLPKENQNSHNHIKNIALIVDIQIYYIFYYQQDVLTFNQTIFQSNLINIRDRIMFF